MLKTAFLSLGSNLGNRESNLRLAMEKISAQIGNIARTSSVYETEPMELIHQPWFLNCAIQVETEKTPEQLLQSVLAVEQEMGRRRTQPKGPRNIDIDILFFGDSAVVAPGLTIPHPSMHERRFVLAPLAEIAPDAIHPVFMRSIRDLLAALPTNAGQVKRL